MKIKPVMRYSPGEKKLRLFRVIWVNGTVGDGLRYSARISVSLTPKLYRYNKDYCGWRLIICGLEIHHAKSYGGIFV